MRRDPTHTPSKVTYPAKPAAQAISILHKPTWHRTCFYGKQPLPARVRNDRSTLWNPLHVIGVAKFSDRFSEPGLGIPERRFNGSALSEMREFLRPSAINQTLFLATAGSTKRGVAMKKRNPVYYYPPCRDGEAVDYVADRGETLDLIGFCSPGNAELDAGSEGSDLEDDPEDQVLLVSTG